MKPVSECSTSYLSEIEQIDAPVSLPAEPPGTAAAPAPAGEAPSADTYELVPRDGLFASPRPRFETAPAKKSAETAKAAGSLPEPPPSPRERGLTIAPAGLRGAELERALAHNEKCWSDYAQSYRAYLDGYREAFAGCRDLAQLRNLQPEPPDDAMAMVGHEQQYQQLDRELRRLYGEKVERGYELIGETPPGTLILMLKGSAKLLGVGATATLSADSKGGTSMRTQATANSPIVKLRLDDRGQVDVKVGAKIDGFGAKVGPRGIEVEDDKLGGGLTRGRGSFDMRTGKLTVGTDVVPGVGFKASYDPTNAVYGGGISVGKAITAADGTKIAELRAEVDLMFKGMSKEDVKRALDGWLVPDRLRGGATSH